MEVVEGILLQFIKWFTLVAGLIGVGIFSLPFISTDTLLAISRFFNRTYDIDTPVNKNMNHLIGTDSFTYKYRIILGILMILGACAFFCLVVTFRQNHVNAWQDMLHLAPKWQSVSSIFYTCLILLSQLSGILALAAGILLLFLPQKLKILEQRLNRWLSTEPLEDKWNETAKDVDTLFFLHPYLLGSIGLSLSLFLTILAFWNIYR